jgi:precorrin-2 methylase
MRPVYAVSLGPGPADLMTVRARNALGTSDRVFVQSRDPAWFDKVIGEFVPADRIRMYLPKAAKWGLARGDPVNDVIAGEIADLVRAGKQVSVAAPGDVSFYSYFGYLEGPLARRGVTWEYVPGIPFLTAAPMVVGNSFVEASDTLVVKHVSSISELDALFAVASVLVLYGIARDLFPQIREYAIRNGIEYARTVWLDASEGSSYAADLLAGEQEWRLGFSIILRRRHPVGAD